MQKSAATLVILAGLGILLIAGVAANYGRTRIPLNAITTTWPTLPDRSAG